MQQKFLKSVFVAVMVVIMVLSVWGAIGYADASPMFVNISNGDGYDTVNEVIDQIMENQINIDDVYKNIAGTDKYVSVVEEYQAKQEAFLEFLKSKGIDLASHNPDLIKNITKTVLDNKEDFQKVMSEVAETVKEKAVSYDDIQKETDKDPKDFDSYPKLEIKDEAQVFVIPADPDRGFNFPYALRIPAKNKARYSTNKKYLIFNMINNTMIINNKGETQEKNIEDVVERMEKMSTPTIQSAYHFGYPIMMPIIPRTRVSVYAEGLGEKFLNEHHFDRAAIYVKELAPVLQIPKYNNQEQSYAKHTDKRKMLQRKLR